MEEWRGANEDWRKLMRSDDCASGLHDYCNVCECECHKKELAEARAEIKKLWQHRLEYCQCGICENERKQIALSRQQC